MFQPHRYSRTQALREEFGRAFGDADVVIVTEIYAASEQPIPGVTGQTIVDAAAANGHKGAFYQPNKKRLAHELARIVQSGDLVISLGAGDIHEQGSRLAADLARLEELQAVMGAGVTKLYEPLAKHTTIRVGGPAQFWLEPETEAGFAQIVRHCSHNGIPLMVIGRGSNLLVRDGGIRGVVVHLSRGEFKKIEVMNGNIHAGAGVKLKEVSYAARDAGIGGLEWMEGIPGNIGGSLRMNAGAMGHETFENVVALRVSDANGIFYVKTPAELDVHYRNVPSLITNYVVSAIFKGAPSTPEAISRLLEESVAKRRASQPRESSAGCIFKNPKPLMAGKLVDELGLKNCSVGNARVSEDHGNFIVNSGDATASDVIALIEKIKATAKEARGVEMETEVQIVGEEEPFYEQ